MSKPVHVWTQVYLPMSYVYGKRGTCRETPLTAAIRGELYPQSYSSIDWNAARNQCAKEDLYYPHPKVLNHSLRLAILLKQCLLIRIGICSLGWLHGLLKAASVSADQHQSEVTCSISLCSFVHCMPDVLLFCCHIVAEEAPFILKAIGHCDLNCNRCFSKFGSPAYIASQQPSCMRPWSTKPFHL